MSKQEIRKDIFGVTPEIGDLIIFNPPKYKGLCAFKCIGFSKSGLPKVEIPKEEMYGGYGCTPRTGFVVYKTSNENK